MNALQEKDISIISDNINVYIPAKDDTYQQYGNFNIIKDIIKSKAFYPIWITGLAGNGKTQMVEQACADLKREFIRINFTVETDESDLIGSLRLEEGMKGATVSIFHEGPVVEALRRGAILLLDEVDIGHTNKIMCLQSVLEGKGVFIKAKNEYVKAEKGFNIFATSNTKGIGAESDKFIGTNIMNGAFLDRFAGMIKQEYPPQDIEHKILMRHLLNEFYVKKGKDIKNIDKEYIVYINQLIEWANRIRDMYEMGTIEDLITTRTLINIIKGYSILNNNTLAMELACERYPDALKKSFMDHFNAMFNTNTEEDVPEEDMQNFDINDDVPF